MRRERLVLAEVLDLHLRAVVIVDDLERPGLDILLHGWVVESSADQAPLFLSALVAEPESHAMSLLFTHLISKTVFVGFIAAWFFAASPIKRSSDVKETKDGVVKEPCSLATVEQFVRHDASALPSAMRTH